MAGLVALACCRAAPQSVFPSAQAALERMRASRRCSQAVQGEGSLEYFGEQGRLRSKLLYLVALPENLRLDLYSPFGASLMTLTSDGRDLAVLDLKNRAFFTGRATSCNVAHLTRVPVPPFVLVQLLRGEAPVLAHRAGAARIGWKCSFYEIRIDGDYQARETIELEPHPADWNRPWPEQRLRVRAVEVEQYGLPLYRAELSDYRRAVTAEPEPDHEGTGQPGPASGAQCDAELPRALRLTVPDTDQVVILRSHEVAHNPRLDAGVFRQSRPPGTMPRAVACE